MRLAKWLRYSFHAAVAVLLLPAVWSFEGDLSALRHDDVAYNAIRLRCKLEVANLEPKIITQLYEMLDDRDPQARLHASYILLRWKSTPTPRLIELGILAFMMIIPITTGGLDRIIC
jgi:hypothetical protein